MPDSMSRTVDVAVLGKTYKQRTQVDANNSAGSSPTLAAAKTGTLSARTDNDTGTLTMTAGHGIQTGDKLDVYWTDGVRYNMAATVTVNSVAVDGGAGDNLPSATTPITAMVPNDEVAAAAGDDVVAIAANSPVKGVVCLLDGSDAVLFAMPFRDAAGGTFDWITGDLATNPLAGDTVAKIRTSHGDSSAARTVTGRLLYN